MTSTRPIRIATFNIRHGRVGRHWPSLPWRLRQGVALIDADIIGLQEVDRHVVRSWFMDQASFAARSQGALDHAFATARPFGPGGRYGNALTTRGWIHGQRTVELPVGTKTERRVALLATVDCRWLSARVLVTHLQNHDGDATAQLEDIPALLPPDGPAVIMGDLNLPSTAVRPVLEGAGFTLAGGGHSSPADNPYQRIDHIAVRGLDIVEVEVPRAPVSDHRPVVATVVPAGER